MKKREGSLLEEGLVRAFLIAFVAGIAWISMAANDLFWRTRMVRKRKPIEKKIGPALKEKMKTGRSNLIKIVVEIPRGANLWSNRYFRASKCWREFFVTWYKNMLLAEMRNKGQDAVSYGMFRYTIFAFISPEDIKYIASKWCVEEIKLSSEWRQ